MINPGQSFPKDPSVALPTVTIKGPSGSGPIRSQQFVIELVGPRTVSADAVKAILRPEWQSVLSNPEAFVMSGADSQWRPLVATDTARAYDSIALAWDLLSPLGLSQNLAQRLWDAAEDLARQLSRRALAMPVPPDVTKSIRVLSELKGSLDIGVNLSVVPIITFFDERTIWETAGALGLDYAPGGQFYWRADGSDLPLFELYTLNEGGKFALSQLGQASHEGIGLGFSVPLCPDPSTALEGCLKTASVFGERLRGQVLDEEDRPLRESAANKMRSDLAQAVGALTRAGLAPGSREAIKLFGS